MLYLLLSITCSTSILIIFKYLDRFRLNTFDVILVSYLAAASIGILMSYGTIKDLILQPGLWMIFAVIIGISFVIMFYVIGFTTRKLGVTVSSVSGRMSVIIPMLFSILYDDENLGLLKITGIILAMISVGLITIRDKSQNIESRFLFLPFILFFGMGTIDSLIKYTQARFLGDMSLTLFSTLVFSVSAISSVIFRTIKPIPGTKIDKPVFLAGILLGLVNFFSLYFIIKALTYSNLASSIVFGINNTGIVLLSIISALILFREKLNRYNWAGAFISVITILVLTWSA